MLYTNMERKLFVNKGHITAFFLCNFKKKLNKIMRYTSRENEFVLKTIIYPETFMKAKR